MKVWFVKSQISAALDEGKAPWAWLRRWASGSRELRTIEPEMIALDRALRQTAPKSEVPASLHYSIMGAIRGAGAPLAVRRPLPLFRWLAAPALVLVGLVMLWTSVHRTTHQPPVDTQVFTVARIALDAGGQIADAAPAAVVAPLSDELARLNQDLERTAQFVLASVP